MGGELTQVTNVATLVGVGIGIVIALAWAVPKLAGLFKQNGDNHKRTSSGPDSCVHCREKVDHTLLTVREMRSEAQHRDENLAIIMGEVRDLLRDFLVEERLLRQTGHGMRVPGAHGAGGGSRL